MVIPNENNINLNNNHTNLTFKEVREYAPMATARTEEVNTLNLKTEQVLLNNAKLQESKTKSILKNLEEKQQKIENVKKEKEEELKFQAERNVLQNDKRKLKRKIHKIFKNDSYILCKDFLHHNEMLNKKVVHYFESDSHLKYLEKYHQKFRFGKNNIDKVEVITDFETMQMGKDPPEQLLKKNLSQGELDLLKLDTKYFIRNKEYLDKLEFLKPTSLLEKIKAETAQENKIKKIRYKQKKPTQIKLKFNKKMINTSSVSNTNTNTNSNLADIQPNNQVHFELLNIFEAVTSEAVTFEQPDKKDSFYNTKDKVFQLHSNMTKTLQKTIVERNIIDGFKKKSTILNAQKILDLPYKLDRKSTSIYENLGLENIPEKIPEFYSPIKNVKLRNERTKSCVKMFKVKK